MIFREKSVLLAFLRLLLIFAFSALLSFLTGKIILTDAVYAPVSRTENFSGVSECVNCFLSCGFQSAIQLLLIHIAADTVYFLTVSRSIAVWRGLSFGFTLSLISNGALVSDDISVFGMPISGCMPSVISYASVSAMVLIFSAVSRYSEMSDSETYRLYDRRARGFALLVFCGASCIMRFTGALFI